MNAVNGPNAPNGSKNVREPHEPRVIRAAAVDAAWPHVPVAIVGAGACGLTAALMLRDAGIDCVLLERDARAQGSTALSSGLNERSAFLSSRM